VHQHKHIYYVHKSNRIKLTVISGGGTSIDGAKLNIIILHHNTGDKTSDTSESINTHTSAHLHVGTIVGGGLQRGTREGVGVGARDGGDGNSGGELHDYIELVVVLTNRIRL